jgi:hypothetical protein
VLDPAGGKKFEEILPIYPIVFVTALTDDDLPAVAILRLGGWSGRRAAGLPV